MVDSVDYEILVDTGATLTIIAEKLYDQIERIVTCELQQIGKNTTIVGADGTPLKFVGSGESFLQTGFK